MSNNLKRRKSYPPTNESIQSYDVEKIVDLKWVKKTPCLLFLVKWLNFSVEWNTYESLETLELNQVFRDYIALKTKLFQDDIVINYSKIINSLWKEDTIKILANQRKCLTLHEIQPFDPFEFKVYLVCYHLLPDDESFNETLQQLALKNYFYKLDENQRKRNDGLVASIIREEALNMIVENEEDFGTPPEFSYTRDNILSSNVAKEPSKESKGCDCRECTKESHLCSRMKGRKRFAYKKTGSGRTVLTFLKPDTIYECGSNCECSDECINRLSQKPSNVSLCLFKTENRGWGIRAREKIPKSTYLFHYSGEVLNQEEADQRHFAYYMFDMIGANDSDDFFTIDAGKFGNLSRFVNHSCEPNASIWIIAQCDGDPKKQKLG